MKTKNFLKTLKLSNKTSRFYFDVSDIITLKSAKKDIEGLNVLIGEKNFNEKLKSIIINNPHLVPIFPLLVGVRDSYIELLIEYTYKKPWISRGYDFSGEDLDESKIEGIIDFFERVGLKDFFENAEIKDVYSYLLGIHLGLRTNARKNKSGEFMEQYIDSYVKNLCREKGLEYLSQATSKDILINFNIDISPVVKNKRIDFVINDKGKLLLIEVNFYNSTGSKIKSVAQEFVKFNQDCLKSPFVKDFIWITDGAGWLKERKTLERTFSEGINVININDMHNQQII